MYSRNTQTLLASAIALVTLTANANNTQLEEVVVTASRNETPLRQVGASVSVINEADIQLQAATSLNELLRNQPGITTSNSGGLGKDSALRIRGEEGYRTLIMIDGVEMTDPTGTQAMSHVEHLNIGPDIERVEILRGPQGFIYGADAGGVINIFTRTSQQGIDGGIAIEGGSYNTQKLNASLSGGNNTLDGFISATSIDSDGFNARTDDESGETDGYENTTLHVKGAINFNSKFRAQLVMRDQNATSEYDNCDFEVNNCVAEFEQGIARLSLRYAGETTQHQLAYNSSDIERRFFTNDLQSYAISGSLQKAEYLGDKKFNNTVSAVWGSDYKKETLDGRDGDADQTRNQLGLFAEIQSHFKDTIYVTAGLRHDDNEDFGKHNSYRVTAAWLPLQSNEQTLKLRTSGGTGFRAPALSEISYNRGPWAFGDALETDLNAETSEGIDLGLDYFLAFTKVQEINLGITFFSQKVENEIYFDLIDYSGYLQAEGKSKSHGVELSVDYQITSRLTLLANNTWNPTQDRDGEPRVRRPENTSNLGARISLLQENFNLLVNLFNARDAIDIDGSKLDDYSLLSLSANWKIADWLLSARIDNLSNRDYQQVSGYNTAERTINAGVQYQF